VKKFNDAYAELLIIAPTIDTVNEYQTRDEDVAFVFAFRKILRIMNVLKSFVDFSWYDLNMTEQDYEDYKSKYLDIYHKLKEDTEKVSILNDVDFELELLHRDDVNVAYILKLLAHYINGLESEKKRIEESVEDLLGGTPEMRSKKEMIMKFIRENLPSIVDEEAIEEEFRKYWEIEREKALQAICTEENISRENLQIVISQYIFSEKLPLTGDIIKILEETPSVLLRRKVAERVIMKIVDFVETYVSE
jgi:type I restriction enzyme R subunit